MISLSRDEYLALREGAEVVEADRFGDKVLRLADGSYFKMFRRKRLISSALFYLITNEPQPTLRAGTA